MTRLAYENYPHAEEFFVDITAGDMYTDEMREAAEWNRENNKRLYDDYSNASLQSTQEAGYLWNMLAAYRDAMGNDGMDDPVKHPSHYTSGPVHSECGKIIECIDVAGEQNFRIGSALKYLWRYNLKGKPVEDLRKAIEYIEMEIKKLENEK